MKTSMQRMKWLLGLMLIGFSAGMSIETKAQQGSVSFQVFYNELQPYGTWLIHPRFGDVWRPNTDGNFTPYLTNGYWTVTQYGNTWVSDYDWGWATFHYGRWYYDNFDGWIWIPDSTWAPAWVVWRNGGGYYGWAPLSPGLNFSVSFSMYNAIPSFYWSFVPYQYVWDQSVYSHCSPRNQNITIVNNTTYVTHYHGDNNHHYYTGPSHDEIRRATNRPVKIIHVQDDDKPGRGNIDRDKISMYRPSINKNGNGRPPHSTSPHDNNGHHYGNGQEDEHDKFPGENNGNDNPRGQGPQNKKQIPVEREKPEITNDSRENINRNDRYNKSNDQNIPTQSSTGNSGRNKSLQKTTPESSNRSSRNLNFVIPNKSSGSRGNSNTIIPNKSSGSKGTGSRKKNYLKSAG